MHLTKLAFGTIDIADFDKEFLTVTTLGDSPVFFFDGLGTKRIAKNPKKYMIELLTLKIKAADIVSAAI